MRLLMAAVLLLAPTLAQAWPWSMDMANQISIKPQESADTQNPGMRPFPKRSVPIPGTTSLVKDREVAEKQSNPVPADEKSIALGGKLFQIYCTPCHGYSGKGDGLVGAKLALTPYTWHKRNRNSCKCRRTIYLGNWQSRCCKNFINKK